MESKQSKQVRWRSIRTLFTVICLVAIYLSYHAPHTTTAAMPITGEPDLLSGVRMTAAGDIELGADAAAPPLTNDQYHQYGYYISPVHQLDTATSRIKIAYDASVAEGSMLTLDLRVSSDGEHWTAWETDLTNGEMVNFSTTASKAQYRARLFGSEHAGPTLHTVELYGVSVPNEVHAAPADTEIAPTYTVRATREGLVGYRTANGHIIQPRDHFVSLPSWRSLSSLGGNEYQVRVTYKGRSAVAPVWDVGPWNTRDDYWNIEREVWKDLPRGWPQDHAAYFDGHNGGYAQHGYVTFPTAIDIADGVWWDVLNIHGDQAQVEVTFLWLGRDPLAVPSPSTDPNASEYMVDELGTAFHLNDSQSVHTSANEDWECGADGHTYWAVTRDAAAQSENEVFWHPDLPVGGTFDVYAYIPSCPNDYHDTEEANYLIQHQEGTDTVVVNQAEQKGWVRLGRFPFAAGDAGFVQLTDLAGTAENAIWFDNLKWVPVGE